MNQRKVSPFIAPHEAEQSRRDFLAGVQVEELEGATLFDSVPRVFGEHRVALKGAPLDLSIVDIVPRAWK